MTAIMPVHTCAIEALVAAFGLRLQYLHPDYRTFMLKCLVHQYSSATPMSDLIDELDPDALIPERVCDAIVSLDDLTRSEMLGLMETIVAQLKAEVK